MQRVNKQSIVGSILASALKIWLKSQVEKVEALQIEVAGSDFQLLQGTLPKVAIASRRAVYQGIHLSQIRLESHQIRLSVGQILKGYPIRLLEPVPVWIEAVIAESDWQASLAAPLLSTALTETFLALLDHNTASLPTALASLHPAQICWRYLTLTDGELALSGRLNLSDPLAFTLRAGVASTHRRYLHLQPLYLEIPPGNPLELEAFPFDLGSEIEIKVLRLSSSKLAVSGKLMIVPPSL